MEETNKKDEVIDTVAVDITKIENALVVKNVTRHVLDELKKFQDLTIADINDKEGYKLVEGGRKMCKKIRGLAIDVCTEGREGAIAEQKAWIAKQKEIVNEILQTEELLAARQKTIDDEKKKIKEEKDREEQMRWATRSNRLTQLGMKLVGDNYVLAGLVINVLHLKVYDDFTFESAVAPVEAEATRLKEEKAIEDAKLKELQDAQQKERERLDQEKKDQDAKQKQLEEGQAKLEAEKKALFEAKIKSRKTSLFSIGFSQQHNQLLFKELSVSDVLIQTLSDEDWLKLLEKTTAEVEQIKAQLEKERSDKVEKEKKEAVEKALKDKADAEAKTKKEADDKAAKEAEIKAHAEALRPDEEKYQLFLKLLENLNHPEFSTAEYQRMGVYMKETVVKMINHFNKEKDAKLKTA